MRGSKVRDIKEAWRRDREIATYGCTVAELQELVEDSITFKMGGAAMLAAGMMSDCQEMMAYNVPDRQMVEDVRKTLNRAKWVLSNYTIQAAA